MLQLTHVQSVHFLLSVANGSKKCNGNAPMPNELYGDTDMHIFLFRSKDAIKTMRIAGYYTFNQRG